MYVCGAPRLPRVIGFRWHHRDDSWPDQMGHSALPTRPAAPMIARMSSSGTLHSIEIQSKSNASGMPTWLTSGNCDQRKTGCWSWLGPDCASTSGGRPLVAGSTFCMLLTLATLASMPPKAPLFDPPGRSPRAEIAQSPLRPAVGLFPAQIGSRSKSLYRISFLNPAQSRTCGASRRKILARGAPSYP